VRQVKHSTKATGVLRVRYSRTGSRSWWVQVNLYAMTMISKMCAGMIPYTHSYLSRYPQDLTNISPGTKTSCFGEKRFVCMGRSGNVDVMMISKVKRRYFAPNVLIMRAREISQCLRLDLPDFDDTLLLSEDCVRNISAYYVELDTLSRLHVSCSGCRVTSPHFCLADILPIRRAAGEADSQPANCWVRCISGSEHASSSQDCERCRQTGCSSSCT